MRFPLRSRPRGLVTALAAVLVAVLLAAPRLVPNTAGHLGSLVETFRPWLGVAVPVLAVLAWWRRSPAAAIATLLPAVVWAGLVGGRLLPADDRAADLVVVQHNAADVNPDPAGTVREILTVRPDLVALEEVVPANAAAYTAAFGSGYPYFTIMGTVGLWSRHPLTGVRPVDIRPHDVGPDWNRGLRAVAHTPHGDVAVYVAHLPSVRIGPGGFDCTRRDESARLLGAAVDAEPLGRVLLLGDLNGTVDDRGLKPISDRMATARARPAFSWPASVPLARIDQVFGRELGITEVWSLGRTGSDHLPVAAKARF